MCRNIYNSYLLAILIVCIHTLATQSQRVEYNFDFGWKFKLGNVDSNVDLCPANAFPIDLTNFYCPTWAHQAAYQITEAECRLYCCGDSACAGYSYSNGFCAIGNSIADCVRQNGFSGAARAVPASTPPPPPNGPQNPNYNDSTWDSVNVPHDYVVQQVPSINEEWTHGYRARNISWYRKKFTLDGSFKNQIVYLEFDGVYRSSDFWLNGRFLGHHSSGYTSFRFRLDNFPGIVIPGDNVLSVRLDPRSNEGWWYEGAGIYRHTKLVRTNFAHFSPWGIYVPSEVIGTIYKGTDGLLHGDSLVEMYVNISNRNSAPVTVYTNAQIFDSRNLLVYNTNLAEVTISPGDTVTVYGRTVLVSATLWDPSQPTLYKLVTTLYSDTTAIDTKTTTFGARKVQFDPNYGFFLNDRNTKVRGVCNHQDFAGVGTAVPDRANKFRIEKLMSMGVNAWRMSHNPPNPELLDYADQLGMLVWDENRFFGNFSQWYDDLRDMILRDRNHPSIIWWSLCNEWGCQQYDMNGTVAAGLKFREILKRLDLTRPISGAWNGDIGSGVIWAQYVCDIMGINYNYGSYDSFHSELPTTPLISSESCSCTSDRSIYVNTTDAIIGPANAWPCIRDCWQPVATRDFVMGSFDWTGFDYRGEESPTVWPAINSHFGGIDLSGYEKDAMLYFKAWFEPDIPVVQIVPQDLTFLSTSSDLTTFTCGNALTGDRDTTFRWKFGNSSTVGSVLQSVSNPSLCVKGESKFPASMYPCQPSDPSFQFYIDNYGQIYYKDGSGNKMCMDIFAGTGPQVGFYECKNSGNSNQDWRYVASGEIQSLFQGNTCVGAGSQVLLFTNGDSVEFSVDGTSVGTQTIPPFEAGSILVSDVTVNSITATVKKGGADWGTQTVGRGGSGSSITLVVERPTGGPIVSDGQDVALLTASVVDSSGKMVRVATDLLTFTVVSGNGRIVGTGNGNPSDHTPDQGNQRNVWNGLVRVVVGANLSGTSGQIVVRASAPGLGSAQVTINTVPPSSEFRII